MLLAVQGGELADLLVGKGCLGNFAHGGEEGRHQAPLTRQPGAAEGRPQGGETPRAVGSRLVEHLRGASLHQGPDQIQGAAVHAVAVRGEGGNALHQGIAGRFLMHL